MFHGSLMESAKLSRH